MKKQANGKRSRSRRTRQLVLSIVVIASVTICAAAAINMRTSQARSQADKNTPARKLEAARNPINLAAQQGQNGQIRPLTQDEAQRLAQGLKELVNPSSEGLQSVKNADGSISVDLQGRYQNVTLAKETENGVETACVDNREAGAAFFGIDPALVGATTRPGSSPKGKGEIK